MAEQSIRSIFEFLCGDDIELGLLILSMVKYYIGWTSFGTRTKTAQLLLAQ